MENVIYNELRMRGYSVDVGVVIIAEKDQEGKVTRKQLEVDFCMQSRFFQILYPVSFIHYLMKRNVLRKSDRLER